MSFQKTAGLIGAGGVNQSFLARLPAALEQLGPVKGSSLRVSRRIANGLRAGFGVDDYRALVPCGFIWILAPETALDFITAELASAVSLDGKTVVLCDSLRDSLRPSPLRTAGARVATLNCLPESSERKFVGEGHPAALAQLRKLLALDRRKMIELHPATKPLYFAGAYLGSQLLMPWIAGAAESFRAAGFSREEAVGAVEALGVRALRATLKPETRHGTEPRPSACIAPLPAIWRRCASPIPVWRRCFPMAVTACCATSRSLSARNV